MTAVNCLMPKTILLSDLRGNKIPGPGRLLGVGNGNPASHEPDKAKQRSAFKGLCLAIIQSAREPGAIRIQADSPGLKSTAVKVEVR
jgi:beta-galactosidase